jgi:hypothetical protein
MLMRKKARTPRAWKTLETCRSIEAALELVSTKPPPYDNTWRARLHNNTKPWIRRSPKDENLKPDLLQWFKQIEVRHTHHVLCAAALHMVCALKYPCKYPYSTSSTLVSSTP